MNDNLAVKRDKIIEIVKDEGPLLPIAIARKLDMDTTFASAMLGELVDNKTLSITNVKYGGSPFYYISGQEKKLKDLMKHLNEKDLETARLLEEKKILKDRDLSTLQRFGMRQIKDFAKPVRVTIDNEVDLFWRWYLIGDGEVKNLINEYLQRKTETISREIVRDEQVSLQQSFDQKELKQEELKTGAQLDKEEVKEEREIKQERKDVDPLGNFFVENQIDVMDQKIIKKNKEINYIAGVGTDVGRGIFFLKYKNKKRINEADLSLALHESGKLPLIFLSTGELTKKARELLGTEFKGVIFKKI